jgi:hypothetical protein
MKNELSRYDRHTNYCKKEVDAYIAFFGIEYLSDWYHEIELSERKSAVIRSFRDNGVDDDMPHVTINYESIYHFEFRIWQHVKGDSIDEDISQEPVADSALDFVFNF